MDKEAHDSIAGQVLRAGTRISLTVRSHRLSSSRYVIDRTVPNPPVVTDENGDPLNLHPEDVLPGVQVYGQHEISELVGNQKKLTQLLARFQEHDSNPIPLTQRKNDVLRSLRRNRQEIMSAVEEIDSLNERLDMLVGLEQTLERYEQAGLDEQLREKSLLISEERIVDLMPERLKVFEDALTTFRQDLPIDRTFLSSKTLDELPGRHILEDGDEILQQLSGDLERVLQKIEIALEKAHENIAALTSRWNQRKSDVDATYEKILRQSQESPVDAEEFINLRQRIERLKQSRVEKTELEHLLEELRNKRDQLVDEWEYLQAEESRHLEHAAKRINKQLRGHVKVDVKRGSDINPLIELLGDNIEGRLSETFTKLGETFAELEDAKEDTREFVKELLVLKRLTTSDSGVEALRQRYRIPF